MPSEYYLKHKKNIYAWRQRHPEYKIKHNATCIIAERKRNIVKKELRRFLNILIDDYPNN